MIKGIGIGIGIAALCFLGYILLIAPATGPAEKTVAQMKAEADPNNVELARMDPEAALEQLDIKDLPAFVAFLDLDMSITDQSLATYRHIFEQVTGYYANDTPVQIVEAVFRIHETQQYFYDLTYRESLEYLQDTVPAAFDPENPSGQGAKRIRVVANEIHDYLVAAYMKPQIEAMERQQAEQSRVQKRIQSNIAAIRAKGVKEGEARARAEARNEQYIRRNLNWHYRDYNNRYYNNQYSGGRRIRY